MSLKKKVFGQFIFSLVSRFLMLAIKVPLTFFLIHQLSQKEYGFYAIIVSTLGIWISIVDLGWGDYLRRELPILMENAQKKMLKNAASIHGLWSLLLLGMGVLLWKTKTFFQFEDFMLTEGFGLSIVFLLILGGYFPLIQIYLNYSKSIEEFNKITLLQMSVWFSSLLILYFFIPLQLQTILWTWVLSYAVTYIYFFARHRFFIFGITEKEFLIKSFRFGFPLFGSDAGKKILQYYDRYLLGAYSSLSEVAIYHLFNTIFDVAERANQITLHPYIYQAHDEKKISRRNRLMTSLLKSRIVLQILGIAVGALVIFKVPHVLPDNYKASMPLFLLIGAASLMRTAALTPGLSLLLEKKSSVVLVTNTIGIITSVILNLKLIPIYQAYGAAMSLLGSTLVTTCLQLFFLRIWEYLDYKQLFSLKAEISLFREWFASFKKRGL